MLRSPLITVMVAAARKAARALIRDFGELENLQVSVKGPGNFVTNADRRSEEILHQELSKARPKFGFLMEERGRVPGSDPSHEWVVDPLGWHHQFHARNSVVRDFDRAGEGRHSGSRRRL